MGKGKGEDKNAFYRFLDESYFAFWFRQWAAFFIVVGVLLIIAGIVVYEVYPPKQEASFASNQVITSSSSLNYQNWATETWTANYTFQSLQSSGSCEPAGPYVFDLAFIKTSVTFNSNSTITYELTKTKTFRPTDSANILSTISLFNPSYAETVQAQGSEQDVLFTVLTNTSLISKINNFYSTTGAQLVGSKLLYNAIPVAMSATINGTILPTVFGTLNQTLQGYGIAYSVSNINIATKFPCTYCNSSSPFGGGFIQTIQTPYTQQLCGGGSASGSAFLNDLMTNFSSFTVSNPCVSYFRSHSLTVGVWNNTDPTILNNILSSLENNLTSWYDSTYPVSNGYCSSQSNMQTAATTFGAALAQIEDICNNFLMGFFDQFAANNFPSGVSLDDFGYYAFCTSGNTYSPSLPQAVPVQIINAFTKYSPTPFKLEYTSASGYQSDPSQCQSIVNSLTQVSDFVIPLYYNSSASGAGGYSSAILSSIATFLKAQSLLYDMYFAYSWVTGNNYPSGLTFQSFPNFANASSTLPTNVTLYDLALLFAPDLVPAATAYAFTTSPAPVLATSATLFDPIIDANGLLNFVLGLNQDSITNLFGLTAEQYGEIANFFTQSMSSGLVATNNGGNLQGIGYTQFAQAKLACDADVSAGTRCSIASEFYGMGLADSYEFGIAQTIPGYYQSFTSASANVSIVASDVSTIFDYLNSEPETLLNASPNSLTGDEQYAQQYLFYLLSTATLQQLSPTSGIIASRTVLDWLNGLMDPVAVMFGLKNPTFAADPDGILGTFQIDQGIGDTTTSYILEQMNGLTFNPTYPSLLLAGLLNPDGFPTGVSVGSNVNVFDFELQRPFIVEITTTTQEVQQIKATQGLYLDSNWNVNSSLKISIQYLMSFPSSAYAYYSPCDVSVNGVSCSFPQTGLNNSIGFDTFTGLVTNSQRCMVITLGGSSEAFPFSGPNIGKNLYASIQRVTNYDISGTQAHAFTEQYTKVQNTAQAVLLALVIVGGLFLLTGVAFLIFWFIRRHRKMGEKAEMDLVEDPFNEKNKDIARMKY